MARVPEGSRGAAQVAGITWAPAVEGGSLLFGFLRLSSLWPYIDEARGGQRGTGVGGRLGLPGAPPQDSRVPCPQSGGFPGLCFGCRWRSGNHQPGLGARQPGLGRGGCACC